ncbi:MAG TPA: malectin domain-containing carbohydrate-binding protein [Planctomycetota bacterium]|nr:malectin domain-containing carbohydrate-binding protein [Planctomycetota bacterium]
MECLYRINCGDEKGNFTDRLGRVWLADQTLSPGREWGAIGGHGVHRDEAIPPSDDVAPELYRTERYAMKGYEFALPDATYEVKLHFAETFESHYRIGFRAFDVRINGFRLLHEFDPYSAAGGFAKPVVKTFANVGAPDGRLSIELSEGAMINAIEIFRVSSTPAPRRTRKRILFVGNSHCIFWAMTLSVERFVNTTPGDIYLEVHRSLLGGRDMGHHYDQTDAAKKIIDGKYEYVVVQSIPIKDPNMKARFETYAPKYAELARFAGSELLLYCTWPHKGDPLSRFDDISVPHLEVCRRLEIRFVPAGPAWKEALTRRPDLQLFNVSDDIHSGLWGAYLTCCVFYGVLTEKSPVGVVPATVIEGQVNVDPETARFLQDVAWDTVSKYRTAER